MIRGKEGLYGPSNELYAVESNKPSDVSEAAPDAPRVVSEIVSARDIEDLLRALYAGFYACDPYGMDYDRVMSVLEHAIACLRGGRECNCP